VPTHTPQFSSAPSSVAVIGAGLAGLTCARTLQEQGMAVTLFDKGHRPGGRLATRRRDGRQHDHGAQYFTARHAAFQLHAEAWASIGLIAPWDAPLVTFNAPGAPQARDPEHLTRWVAIPGMRALADHLASTLDLRAHTRVTAILDDGERYTLALDDGTTSAPFEHLVLNMPPAQAAALLTDASPRLRAQLDAVSIDPCWATLLTFDAPLELGWGGAFVNTGDALAWIARDSSKPGRPQGQDAWVLHADVPWTVAHLEYAPDEIAASMLAAFWRTTGLPPRQPSHIEAHRWRYARTTHELPGLCLLDERASIAVCGDWCAGGRVEGAFMSGLAAAGRLLGSLVLDDLRQSSEFIAEQR
jgi:renalase